MDMKRLTAGTVVGGIAMYLLGMLIFQLAASDFYAANAGSATGVAESIPKLVETGATPSSGDGM